MSVNSHSCFVENNGEHHIGSFASYTWEFYERINVGRYFTIEIFNEHFGCAYQVASFVIGV
jgi:hypothetical protein